MGDIDTELKQATDRAITAAGGPSAVGRSIGITPQAVGQWERVPAERVLGLSRLSGIPPHEIRPDIYPPPSKTGEAA